MFLYKEQHLRDKQMQQYLLPFLSNQTTKNTRTHNEQVMFSDYTRRGRRWFLSGCECILWNSQMGCLRHWKRCQLYSAFQFGVREWQMGRLRTDESQIQSVVGEVWESLRIENNIWSCETCGSCHEDLSGVEMEDNNTVELVSLSGLKCHVAEGGESVCVEWWRFVDNQSECYMSYCNNKSIKVRLHFILIMFC